MLSCIYWGALFGGAITSILFNIPGEPWSVATTFDGYPMAQQGRAGEALTGAFTSSFVGALVAVLMFTFLAPLVARFALQFGPPEFFSVYLLTFCSFVGTGKGNPVQDHRLDDAGLRHGRGRHRHRHRPAAAHVRFDRAALGVPLPGGGDRPLRHRRDPAVHGGGAVVLRAQREDQSEDRARNLEEAAALLGDLDPQLHHRLLDGHHPGRRDAGLLHELRRRAQDVPERRQVRHRPARGRGRAGNRGACRRHLRAAADDHARHPGFADRGGAARGTA